MTTNEDTRHGLEAPVMFSMETIDTIPSAVKAEMRAAIGRRKAEIAAQLGVDAKDLRISMSVWDNNWETEYVMYCHPDWSSDLTTCVSAQEIGSPSTINELRKKIRRSEAIHSITDNE